MQRGLKVMKEGGEEERPGGLLEKIRLLDYNVFKLLGKICYKFIL